MAKRTHAPMWAHILIGKVCEKYNVDGPELRWSVGHSAREFSSGTHNRQRSSNGTETVWITLNPGSSTLDQAQTLIHELGHHVAPSGEHHGVRYWHTYCDLITWLELPVRYCFYRSALYIGAAEGVFCSRYAIPLEWRGQLAAYANKYRAPSPPKFHTPTVASLAGWQPTEYPWRTVLGLDV